MNSTWTDQYLALIDKLREEIEAYSSDEDFYKVLDGTTNSGGNLAMHLIGNIRHFYGAVLMKDGYERQRENEFAGHQPRNEMLEEWATVRGIIEVYFTTAAEESFDQPYPVAFLGREVSCGYMYLQLLQHFSYHLGQINYHRRAVSA